jgi:hypothetical protein
MFPDRTITQYYAYTLFDMYKSIFTTDPNITKYNPPTLQQMTINIPEVKNQLYVVAGVPDPVASLIWQSLIMRFANRPIFISEYGPDDTGGVAFIPFFTSPLYAGEEKMADWWAMFTAKMNDNLERYQIVYNNYQAQKANLMNKISTIQTRVHSENSSASQDGTSGNTGTVGTEETNSEDSTITAVTDGTKTHSGTGSDVNLTKENDTPESLGDYSADTYASKVTRSDMTHNESTNDDDNTTVTTTDESSNTKSSTVTNNLAGTIHEASEASLSSEDSDISETDADTLMARLSEIELKFHAYMDSFAKEFGNLFMEELNL